MSKIVPLTDLDRRPPEAGRIRLGEKSGRAMKAIDTFRFTSPHKTALDQLAADYGGTVKPWSDPKANKGQYELKTNAKQIEIIIVPGGLNCHYEMWTGGGCVRRCDGTECQVPSRDPNEMYDHVPCICIAKGQAECRPYTRLNVIIPTVDFYGVWRLESKGWNAAKELPGMYDMLEDISTSRRVRAHLNLEQRTSTQGGQTKHFIVPTISIASTANELIEGQGLARPQTLASSGEPAKQIESGLKTPTPSPERSEEDEPSSGDDIVDAQVVDDDREAEIEEAVRSIADNNSLDASSVVATIWDMTGGDYDKLESFISKATPGKTLSFTQNGRLKWTSS